MKKSLFLFVCLTIHSILSAQTPAQLADSVKKGFRGLSLVNNNVVWMSGQKGLVGVLTGTTESCSKWKWEWNRVKGFEKSDFRSIYAFTPTDAVIASAGFPAAILFTNDAGKNWTTSYVSKDSAMFFDGIDFWDTKHGLIYGDPVKGRMYLSETFDGGKTWKEIPFSDRPQLKSGEASFAASGTTIRVGPGGDVWIATGGTVSRLWHSRDYGHHWESLMTPIVQGSAAQGIFSFAFYDTLHGIIVGGDYTMDTLKKDNCFMTNDGGKTWIPSENPPNGYRSCVEYLDRNHLVAVGTTGLDESQDGGKNWSDAGMNRFNTVRFIPGADAYFACGGTGGYGFAKISKNNIEKKRIIFIH